MTRDEALDLLVEVMCEADGIGPEVDRRRIRDVVEGERERVAVYLDALMPLTLNAGRLLLEHAFRRLCAS